MPGGLEPPMPAAGNSEEVEMVGREVSTQLTLNSECNLHNSVAPLSIQYLLCQQRKKLPVSIN